MPTFRGTLFFEENGYGWTESYFKTGTDLTIQQTAIALKDLALARQPILGKEAEIKAARVSQEGVFRDALFADLGAILVGDQTKAADAPDTALLLNCHSTGGTKRKVVYLRGIWDAIVDAGGTYTPTAGWTTRINAFVTKLVQSGWGWLTRGSRVVAMIDHATQNLLSGTVDVVLKTALFPDPFPTVPPVPTANAPAQRVQISGVKGAYQLNGSNLVNPSGTSTFTTKNRLAIFAYTTGGKVTWSQLGFQAIEAADVLRVIERRVGRPSYLSRGRRPAAVRS